MSRVITLTYYDLLRIFRRKALLAALGVLPVILALLQLIFFSTQSAGAAQWVCRSIIAVFTITVIWMRSCSDTSLGLSAGFLCSGVSSTETIISKLLTSMILLLVQVGLYTLIAV